MKPWEQIVSIAALLTIASGAAYAYGRERLANTDLNPVFDQINQQYFDGGLFGVRVEWRTTDNRLGEAEKLGEHDYRIWIDRRENTSITDVRQTVAHESCHIYVNWQEKEEHGPAFRECTKRFPQPTR